MNKIFKHFLLGLTFPCLSAMGVPHKWDSGKFKRDKNEPLRFNKDGKFKILHITQLKKLMYQSSELQVVLEKQVQEIWSELL